MRLLMLTPGTRGDVAPMAGLGHRLSSLGFEVSIAANAGYRELVTAAGCTFRELPGDMTELAHPAAPGSAFSAKDLQFYLKELGAYFDMAASGSLQAAEHGTDMILTNSVAPFGFDIAEALNIPAVGAHLQPNEPSGNYAPLVMGTSRSFGRAGNKALHQLMAASKAPYDKPTARIRLELGLPARSRAASERLRRKNQHPVLHGFSSIVVPRANDWHQGIVNCGYWWPTTDSSWQPSTELVEFLAAGDPPIFIGFGSTKALDPDFMIDTARRTGRRTIVQGAADIRESDILGIGTVPHEWLFPRVAAVVHHAGAGTTAAGLRAGVPAVPVPIFTDQPYWASRLYQLGVGVQPLPYKKLTVDNLSSAINEAVSNERYAHGARSVAKGLSAEPDAALRVSKLLEQHASSH